MLNIHDTKNETKNVRTTKKTDAERQAMLEAERRRLIVYNMTHQTRPSNTLAGAFHKAFGVRRDHSVLMPTGREYYIDGQSFVSMQLALDYLTICCNFNEIEAQKYLASLR